MSPEKSDLIPHVGKLETKTRRVSFCNGRKIRLHILK